MSSSPPDRCGYMWPEDYEIEDEPNHQSCCWREVVSEKHDQCVWHVDPDDYSKPIDILKATREASEMRGSNSPYDELLDGANLSGVKLTNKGSFKNVALRDSIFSDADLSGAKFWDANLSGAVLKRATLTDTEFKDANLSGANFWRADLSDAILEDTILTHTKFQYAVLSGTKLWYADLSDAYLSDANLSSADFWHANLSNANLEDTELNDTEFEDANLQGVNLSSADISGANFRSTNFSGADFYNTKNIKNISVDGSTVCRRLDEGYDDGGIISNYSGSILLWLRRLRTGSDFDSNQWDATARAYHDLKIVFNDHGLIGKARKKHVQERRSRRLETKVASGWSNWKYIGSYLSWVFVGYGVQVKNLLSWMIVLFLVPTALYVYAGVEDTLMKNISYSVLAYTVAPPKIPVEVGIQLVMIIETFFGTLSIVLLGYILGNREQF